MWKPSKQISNIFLFAEVIGVTYGLFKFLSKGLEMIGPVIFYSGLIHAIYAFLISLGVVGLFVLNWNTIIYPFTTKKRRKEKIETAYIKLRNVCEPKTLNPTHPGNSDFMKSDARDFINPFRTELEDAGLGPPKLCTTEETSLKEWFDYFGKLRNKYPKKNKISSHISTNATLNGGLTGSIKGHASLGPPPSRCKRVLRRFYKQWL